MINDVLFSMLFKFGSSKARYTTLFASLLRNWELGFGIWQDLEIHKSGLAASTQLRSDQKPFTNSANISVQSVQFVHINSASGSNTLCKLDKSTLQFEQIRFGDPKAASTLLRPDQKPFTNSANISRIQSGKPQRSN